MTTSTSPMLLTVLPGPDRKRRPAVYRFVQRYRNPNAGEIGCVATWEILGGRMPYQIALERDPARHLHWHCTCAQAIYRGELTGEPCKHVQGLVDFLVGVEQQASVARAA